MIQVAMRDLRFEGAAWRGMLHADDVPVCELAGTPTSEPVVLHWAEDCGPADLAALVAHDPALETRAASIAAEALARHLLAADLKGAVLMIEGDALLRVAIPEGGDLAGALAFARSAHPDAVVLNDLEMGEAVDRLAALP